MSSITRTLVLQDRPQNLTTSPGQAAIQRARYPKLEQLESLRVVAPLGILSRLAGASIDPLTIGLSRHLFGLFHLGHQGRVQIPKALGSLTAFPSFGSILWFGFGIKHPIHILAESAQGEACIAICACLAEAHSAKDAAYIIDDVATELYGDRGVDNLRPSLNMWLNLITICQGFLAKSTFGLCVEEFMRLCDETTEPRLSFGVYTEVDPGKTGLRAQGSIKDTSKALIALANVSNGQLKSITLAGQAECSILAAIASWLLNLSVVVKDSAGKTLYARGPQVDNAQVTWLISHENDTAMEVVEKVFSIQNAQDFISFEDNTGCLSGRVPWNSALASTFGAPMKRLLQLETHLASAIGSAARIFTGVAAGAPEISMQQLQKYPFLHDSSHGVGLVNTALEWFTELSNLRPGMDAMQILSLKDAISTYEDTMKLIAVACNCNVCSRELSDNESENFDKWGDIEPFCLVLLTYTILCLVQCMSSIGIHPENKSIQPSRLGIETFYHRDRERGAIGPTTSFTIGRLLQNINHSVDVLTPAALIYTGRQFSLSGEVQFLEGSAIQMGGFCFYFEALINISDRDEVASLINVVPGHIMHGTKAYNLISDYRVEGPDYAAIDMTYSTHVPRIDASGISSPTSKSRS